MEDNFVIQLLTRRYAISHNVRSIVVDINNQNRVTVYTNQNNTDFKFIGSKPCMLRDVGSLLVRAADLAIEKEGMYGPKI